MDEDMILPDDFEESLPEEVETQETETFEAESNENPFESETDTNLFEDEQATEETGDTPPTPQTIRIKYNHEEQEIPLEEAVPLVQKGMNYDKLQERVQQLETDPRLSFVEDLAREQGMDVNEYLDAVKAAREQQHINELVQQNIPEEYAREMLETRKFREQIEAEKKAKEEEARTNQSFQEFFQYFNQANGRDFNPQQDKIPDEVWYQVNQGVPLKYAYMEHHNSQLKSQLSSLKQNKTNEQRAPISGVSTHGSQEVASEDPFLAGFDSI